MTPDAYDEVLGQASGVATALAPWDAGSRSANFQEESGDARLFYDEEPTACSVRSARCGTRAACSSPTTRSRVAPWQDGARQEAARPVAGGGLAQLHGQLAAGGPSLSDIASFLPFSFRPARFAAFVGFSLMVTFPAPVAVL